jgi:ATP-dependent helicase YprA (DUF1998 family)
VREGGREMAFYDLTPGGLGIVHGGFSAYARWVDAALRLAACRCRDGCPLLHASAGVREP